jgi:cation diffusion facilitator CzcD-associated flavoprotein CzcO
MTDVAIIGAGPYGLAAAAELRAAGIDICAFGRPMSFWSEHMPGGMLLRSPYVASSIGSAQGPLSLDAFAASQGVAIDRPVPLELFVDYGRWVQATAVPDLDQRLITRVERDGSGFTIVLDEDDRVPATRVVVAGGIKPFAHVPPVFAGLPAALVSHTSQHRDLSVFSGRRVLVIGGGQSALESAALLHEAAADVEVVTRAPMIRWLGQRPWLRELGPVSTLLYAPAEVGPPLLSQLVEVPGWVRRLPPGARRALERRSVRPAGAGWLRPRVVDAVPVRTGRTVVRAEDVGERVTVTYHDGASDTVEHVLLGTGYRVDIARYPFLSPQLTAAVHQVGGYPVLRSGLESSIPGLHFLGAPAAWSFGPLMRFVAGSEYVALQLTRHLVHQAGRRSGREPVRL